MDLSLRGKRALVCGSTQGLGRASAVEIAQLGATVTLMARDEARLKKTVAELPAKDGQKHETLVADFSQPEAVAAAVKGATGLDRPFHVVVNNTGGPPGGLASEASPDAYIAAFKMHIVSNQAILQLVLPGMKSARYGRIINIISTSVKAPIPGLGVSNTIRAAVANWAKTLAGELGPHGITVNNVLPGYTETARLESLFKMRAEKAGKGYDDIVKETVATIPAGRLGRPEDIGAVVAFLASPAAGYVNGINVPVDGGRTQGL
jgi:3-oxoacyl-[acyl-carrier protein] reductase